PWQEVAERYHRCIIRVEVSLVQTQESLCYGEARRQGWPRGKVIIGPHLQCGILACFPHEQTAAPLLGFHIPGEERHDPDALVTGGCANLRWDCLHPKRRT